MEEKQDGNKSKYVESTDDSREATNPSTIFASSSTATNRLLEIMEHKID